MTPTTPPTAIDFAQVRSRCPKAFAALITWFCQDKAFQYTPTSKSPGPESIFPGTPGAWLDTQDGLSVGDTRYAYELNVRDLFDFFDQQGVFVLIEYNGTADKPFAYEIEMLGEMYWLGSYHSTRRAAEAAAFMAGFEKLEEIKQKEG